MIENDHQLSVTLQALSRFYTTLASLNRERSRYHPTWFATFAEGPLEDIRRLEAEVNDYIGRTAAESAVADLWIRVVGEGVQWPSGPSSVLSSSLHAARKTVQSIAEYRRSGRIGTRPSLQVARACDFGVTSFAPGSVQFGLQLPDSDDDLHIAACIADLDRIATWVAEEHPTARLEDVEADFELRAVVLTGLVELIPGERSRVTSIELSGRSLRGKTLRFDSRAHSRVKTALKNAMTEQPAHHTGTLREADLDAGTFTLRQVDGGTELPCRFPPELRPLVATLMDRRVVVQGHLRTTATGRKHKRMHVDRIKAEQA